MALFSTTAFADALNYNYVQFGYARTSLDFDTESLDGNGWDLSGSAAINENFHVVAGYNKTGFDFDIDQTVYGIGLGYSKAIADNTDFVATASYLKAKIDLPAGFMSESDDGYGASVGIRSMVSDKVELAGAVDYAKIADSSDTGFSAEALYHVSDAIAVGLEGAWSDGSSTYGAGFRVYFGN